MNPTAKAPSAKPSEVQPASPAFCALCGYPTPGDRCTECGEVCVEALDESLLRRRPVHELRMLPRALNVLSGSLVLVVGALLLAFTSLLLAAIAPPVGALIEKIGSAGAAAALLAAWLGIILGSLLIATRPMTRSWIASKCLCAASVACVAATVWVAVVELFLLPNPAALGTAVSLLVVTGCGLAVALTFVCAGVWERTGQARYRLGLRRKPPRRWVATLVALLAIVAIGSVLHLISHQWPHGIDWFEFARPIAGLGVVVIGPLLLDELVGAVRREGSLAAGLGAG